MNPHIIHIHKVTFIEPGSNPLKYFFYCSIFISRELSYYKLYNNYKFLVLKRQDVKPNITIFMNLKYIKTCYNNSRV